MKRAFTLIELLVVIAIIAILAAILFPVFAQAKLAAKRVAGMAQAKQVGTAVQLYLNDFDDVLMPSATTSDQPINPTYLDFLAKGDARASTMASEGGQTIRAEFFNQALYPYTKSNDLLKNNQNADAWVNFQDRGTWISGYHSYGGQNSYGINAYVSRINYGLASSAIAESSNTVLLVDATYFAALPAQPENGFCPLEGLYDSDGSLVYYWKNLGNGKLDFSNPGNSDPTATSNAGAIKDIESRYGGQVNVVRTDSSAKSTNAKALLNDLRTKGAESQWNPGKADCP